jgi:hypothetical protein
MPKWSHFSGAGAMVLMCALWPGITAAQTATASDNFPAPALKKLRPGMNLFVIPDSGSEQTGRLVSFSERELVVRVGATDVVVPARRILRLEETDSLWNGVTAGALLAAAGVWVPTLLSCSGSETCVYGPAAFWSTAAVMGIGGGVGALIDYSRKGRSVIYARESARVTWVPVLSVGQAGGHLVIRW